MILAAKRDTTARDAITMKIDTGDTEESHHATVQTTDANADIARALLAMIVQSLPGGIDTALPEVVMSPLLGVRKTADEETTRDHLLLQSKNATINVENAGVHLLHLAETIHEAYLLDLDARKY
jgi:hypothetical protein